MRRKPVGVLFVMARLVFLPVGCAVRTSILQPGLVRTAHPTIPMTAQPVVARPTSRML